MASLEYDVRVNTKTAEQELGRIRRSAQAVGSGFKAAGSAVVAVESGIKRVNKSLEQVNKLAGAPARIEKAFREVSLL